MGDVQSLLNRYQGNRVIRGLLQLVPFGIGSALDVVLIGTIEKIRMERAQVYFDELASGDLVVNSALLESEDFLHCYVLTTRLALNSRRREKITMFARLLKNSIRDTGDVDVDEYEDCANILDELSYREIQALSLLDEYSGVPKEDEQSELQWINIFWENFETRLCSQLNIPEEQVPDFMNRIARTGCYEMLTGTYWDYTGGKGKLTPTYRHFKKFIVDIEQ